jgi:gallate dioxygenase
VATGGLSHQVHGERSGFNNTPWDMQFLELIEKDPERLCELTHAEYAEYGGFEGSEVIMWLVMRGAMSANIRKVHQSYYLPSMTAIATAIYENEASTEVGSNTEEYRHHMARQLAGAERIPGTYPFTLERSVKAYRLNKFLHDMIDPSHRKRFLADPEASFAEAELTEEERELVRRRDWRGMIHYGVIFFMLEEARCRRRRVEPAHLRRHARRDARGVSEDAQRAWCAVLRGRQGRRRARLGQEDVARSS